MITRIYLFFAVAVSMLISCSGEVELKKANTNYTKDQLDSISYSLIRYLGKLPGKANHGTKFEAEYDSYYKNLAKSHELVYYQLNPKDNHHYFLFTRIAPSIHLKKVAIGGKLKVEDGELTYYEEAFRTWKMLVPELEQKMDVIFKDYWNGDDLSKYYTKNSDGVEYIEFPDDDNYFDVEKRIWVSSIDYLEPYYELKKGVDTVKSK